MYKFQEMVNFNNILKYTFLHIYIYAYSFKITLFPVGMTLVLNYTAE